MQGISRAQKLRYRSRCSELVLHLPEPGESWRWGDVQLSKSTLTHLKQDGLIHRQSGGSYKTSRNLWRYVQQELTLVCGDIGQCSIDQFVAPRIDSDE